MLKREASEPCEKTKKPQKEKIGMPCSKGTMICRKGGKTLRQGVNAFYLL